MNPQHHTPTATEYDGVVFRSKSEAMFAALLNKRCGDWIYEPDFLSNNNWSPDFAIPISDVHKMFYWLIIEYKPSKPTETYFKNFQQNIQDIRTRIDHPVRATIIYIDWFNRSKCGGFTYGSWPDSDESPTDYKFKGASFLWDHQSIFEEITKTRFDLLKCQQNV